MKPDFPTRLCRDWLFASAIWLLLRYALHACTSCWISRGDGNRSAYRQALCVALWNVSTSWRSIPTSLSEELFEFRANELFD